MGCDNKDGAEEGADQIYRLKNGLSVYHLNKYETDFSYKEIFEDSTYLKHGIALADNACIFDVGANIGMFAMFAKQLCPGAKIFAFEPAPEVCRLLQLNVAQYGSDVQVYQCGLSDKESVTNYTYYPHYSIMSGFHAGFGPTPPRPRSDVVEHGLLWNGRCLRRIGGKVRPFTAGGCPVTATT